MSILNQNNKYGVLLTPDAKLHRKYFDEMCKLIGIVIEYQAPKADKHWTNYAEIISNYHEKVSMGCIFNEHPDQRTLKKIGWVSELQENASLVSVAYDLPNLQVGALFWIPSGLDDGKDRLFRVVSMSNIMIYPASITCEIVPEYIDTYRPQESFRKTENLNLLGEEEESVML